MAFQSVLVGVSPMALAAAAGVCALAAVLYIILLRPYRVLQFYKKQGILHAPFVPLVGQLLETRKSVLEGDVFRVTRKYLAELGPVHAFCVGFYPRLFCADPTFAQEVLVRKAQYYHKGDGVKRSLEPFLGEGLLLAEGHKWKRQRSLMSPAFRFENLKQMVTFMVASVKAQMGDYHRLCSEASAAGHPGHEIDLYKEMTRLTMDIVSLSLFGLSVRESDLPVRITRSLTTVMDTVRQRFGALYGLIPILRDLPFPSLNKVLREKQQMHAIVDLIVENRRAARTKSKYGKDLLDLLLEAKDEEGRMSSEQLRNELVLLILAGHETTSSLLAFCCYHLSTRPDLWAKCREEVDAVLKTSPTGDLDYESAKSLSFLDACLDESLRLSPPVRLVARQAIQDHEVNAGDKKITILKGTQVNVEIRSIHHDPKLWTDPLTYDPSRFLIANAGDSVNDTHDSESSKRYNSGRHPMAFIPFVAGPRSCIGSNFAKVEAKIVMSYLVHNFDISLVPGQRIEEDVKLTLLFKYGARVILKPRAN